MPVVEVSMHGTDVSGRRVPARLIGAINETVDFQLTFRVRGDGVASPTIGIVAEPGGNGALQAGSVQVFRMEPVAVDRFPGWHVRDVPRSQRNATPLDVLVPVNAPSGGIPRTLANGDSLTLWVDVSIPKGTATGLHRLKIELRGKEAAVAQADVELTVLPLVLPDDTAPALIVELNQTALSRQIAATSNDLDRVTRSTMRLLQEHGLNPVLPDVAPRITSVGRGEPQLDWTDYDGLVAPLLDGGAFLNRMPLRHWPLPIRGLLSGAATRSDPQLRPSNTYLRGYIRDVTEHFRQRGWLDRAYALPAVGDDSEWLTAMPRSDTSSACVAYRAFPQDAALDGWVGYRTRSPINPLDIWLAPAQFFDPEAMEQERAGGRRTWMSSDRPPFSGTTSVYARPGDVRILAWQGLALGAEAIHLGSANPWPQTGATPSPQDCLRLDERALLYPGGTFGLTEPVASVRLKELRRAKQDAAYVRLLADRGMDGLAKDLCRRIARFAGTEAYRTHFADGRNGGWVRDVAAFESAREVLIEALASDRVAGSAVDRARTVRSSDAWKRLATATSDVELRIDGARVHWRGAPPNVRAEIEVSASVQQFAAAALLGSLHTPDPPPDWSLAEPSVVEVRPGRDQRLFLRASATSLLADHAGAVTLPLQLLTGDGILARATARIAWAQTSRLARGPRIDGDLADWPAGTTNVAANFISVAVGAPAASKTTALLARDDRFLYVGIVCESPRDDAANRSLARRKGVELDDLIPVDEEDLVEILIDPLNAGSRSPSDLLHVVVKRSGTDLAEKGIGTDPPCSLRAPWAVDLQLATVETSRGWSTEIRIPLAAITDTIDPAAVWGFNVTRWDAATQEFSTWSGATGNAYDPLSLGNLYLP